MKKEIVLLGAVCLALLIPSAARAQCGRPGALRQGLSLGSVRAQSAAVPEVFAAGSSDSQDDPSVVGLWDVTFLAGGQLYDEGFDQYQSDGTEIMNDITPPATGNVCLGVWTKTGTRSFRLVHPFWIFDFNGNLLGRGVLTEQCTLSTRGNNYAGTFTFQFRDLAGNTIPSLPDVSGNLTATRISAN
jgi:hypothetical protein